MPKRPISLKTWKVLLDEQGGTLAGNGGGLLLREIELFLNFGLLGM